MKNAILFAILLIAFNCYTQISCPDNITINCDQDYTDSAITGAVILPDSIDQEAVTVVYTPDLDACSVGTVEANFYFEEVLTCTQIITIENPFPPFDPTTIVVPNDTIYNDCALWEAELPTWTGGPCDFIGYTEDVDTFDFVNESSFKLLRRITVIDWCLYDATDGMEGLFFGEQEIEVRDENPPTPFCVSLWNLGDSQFPHTIEAKMFDIGAFDFCTPKELFRYTFSEVAPENDPEYNPTTRTSSRTFNIEDFDNGSINVDIYHWDLAGNSDYCRIIFYVTEDCLDQEYPLVDANNQWNVTTISGPNYSTTKQRFKSEEVSLQGKKYLQIETAVEENSDDWTDYPLYMRECNGKLFGRQIDTGEDLYFDFNLEQGDTLFSDQYIGAADLRIDSVYNIEYLDGSIRKTLYVEALNGFGYFEMIEGIGSTIFPLTEYQNIAWIDFSKTLGCFTANDEVVYIGDSFSSCWPVGVDDQLDEDAVEIYPNPGFNSIHIQSAYAGNLKIVSVDSKIIFTSELKQGINEVETSTWTSGLYFITLSTEEGSITKRWVKN